MREVAGTVRVVTDRARPLDGRVRLGHHCRVRLKKEDFMSELAFEVRA